MTRPQLFMVLRLVVGTGLALVIAAKSAREWMARERADWDPHYGDPDGESIVQIFGFLVGAGTFLAAILALTVVELALWVRRRRDPAGA